MLELIGLLGGICFAYAGVPSAYLTVKAGKSIGVPINMAILIFMGTILLYCYLYLKFGFDWVLTLNYSVEAISWAVIIKYHYFPVNKK